MPEVIKQQQSKVDGRQPAKTKPSRPAGSILSQAVPLDELDHEKVKIVLYGQNRCIAGDAVIPYAIFSEEGRLQNHKGGSLELLYKRFNGIPRPGKGYYQRPQTVGSYYCVPSVTDEGIIFWNRVTGVLFSGQKEVLRITTASGKSIAATADHRFLTEAGYIPLGELSTGDELVVNSKKRRKGSSGKAKVKRKWLCVKNHARGRLKIVNGVTYYRLSLTHAVYEAYKNEMGLEEYIFFLNHRSMEDVHNLWYVPEGAEIHHLDENPLNDVPSNLFLADSGAAHQRMFHHDAISERYSIRAGLETIVAIVPAGVEDVYDVQVEGPYHNFDAGGIMVHNCGKSTLACQFPKPLLMVSFEPGQTGGSQSVRKIPGITYLRITGKAMAIELARELRSDTYFATHVLDTCTSLQDVILKELMNLEEVPVQLNWGTVGEDYYRERSEQAKEVMRLFRDLNANTVFVCQERDHNPPKGDNRTSKLARDRSPTDESFFAADMGAGTVKWLHDACDYIARLYLAKETVTQKYELNGETKETEEETGRIVRRLRTMLHTNFAAGFRSADPAAVPEYIEAKSPQEMYQAIMEVIAGKKTAKGRY